MTEPAIGTSVSDKAAATIKQRQLAQALGMALLHRFVKASGGKASIPVAEAAPVNFDIKTVNGMCLFIALDPPKPGTILPADASILERLA